MLRPEEIKELEERGYTYVVTPMTNMNDDRKRSRRFRSTGRVVRFLEQGPRNIVIFEVLPRASKIHMAI